MRRASIILSVLTASAAVLGWWSCSSEESSGHAGNAGTDAGGAAGAGATTTGATGGTTSGGGSGGGSGDWGAEPKWEITSAVAVGCPIERMTNAAEVRMFKWQPCSWSASDCEQAVFNPTVVGTGSHEPGFTATSTVQDDGTVVRVGLQFEYNHVVAVYADESGLGLDGIRTNFAVSECHLWNASLWGKRFGVMVAPFSAKQHGGVVGELGNMAQSPIGFSLATQPPGGPQRFILGTDRWLWWWAPLHTYTTVSAADGSGYVEVETTKPQSSLVSLGYPVTTGETFLLDAYEASDAGDVQKKLYSSNGVAAAEPYLVPPDPSDDYDSVAYANTHVAFFRGVQRQDVNLYGSVELWASAYSSSPTELNPSKLGDLLAKSIPQGNAAGWGHIAFPAFVQPYGERELFMWNLAANTKRTHVLPEDHDLQGFLGVTRKHLWLGSVKPGSSPPSRLIRILLE